jgi:hypothetical protein
VGAITVVLPNGDRASIEETSARLVARWSTGDITLAYASLRQKLEGDAGSEATLSDVEAVELSSLLDAIHARDEAEGRGTPKDLGELRTAAQRALS